MMHKANAWRCDSDADYWTCHFNSCETEWGTIAQHSLALAEWCLLWERQICLETIRDSSPDSHQSILQSRLSEPVNANPPTFWHHSKLIEVALARLPSVHPSSPPNVETLLAKSLTQILRQETKSCLEDLLKLGYQGFISKTLLRVEPNRLFHDVDGRFIDSNTSTPYWGHWYPGLSNDHESLSSLIDSLPGASDADIPAIVQSLENPASPMALPGAVTLKRHDVLHILLGRGLLDQDEAFVVGFTMGNASQFNQSDGAVMRNALEHIYPEPFRISGSKLTVFDIGVQAGKQIGVPDIAKLPVEELYHLNLGQIRKQLKISANALGPFYAQEKQINPKSIESGRLPLVTR